jgi:hypothetical protein
MVKPALRTKSITAKVTEEEWASLERLAAASGQSMNEWCRGVLLERVNGHVSEGREPVVLAEVLALRTILLNLFYALSRGEEITGEEMQEIIARADAEKLTKARARLQGAVADKPEASA